MKITNQSCEEERWKKIQAGGGKNVSDVTIGGGLQDATARWTPGVGMRGKRPSMRKKRHIKVTTRRIGKCDTSGEAAPEAGLAYGITVTPSSDCSDLRPRTAQALRKQRRHGGTNLAGRSSRRIKHCEDWCSPGEELFRLSVRWLGSFGRGSRGGGDALQAITGMSMGETGLCFGPGSPGFSTTSQVYHSIYGIRFQNDCLHGNEYPATSPAGAMVGSELKIEDKLPPRTPNLTLFTAEEVPLEAWQ
ncbi:hypothetical protein BDZ45DRAFT_734741 [Acephala macrosclerotiorum]|nr:hypothetical protein BDZ45DRAFT_734741 [Acephala macrosclerotiorum]